MKPEAWLAIGAIVLFVLIVVGRASIGRGSSRPGSDHERDRSERWARARDVPQLVVTPGLAERAVLGTLDGRQLAMPALESVMVYAPTGAGKTARYVVPTVLRWKGAAVVTSVKGDAVALTIAHRETQGPVWVFDPTGTSGRGNCRWLPLDSARTYPGALKAAAWLTDSSQVEKVTSNEQQLWATLGEQLLAPLLYAAARTDRGMDAVSDWILFRREDEVSMILEELGDRDAEAHWASIRATEGRTKQSIFVTAQRIMHVFSHPLVRGALAPTGDGAVFRPEDLLDTGGTLYVVSPAEEQELFTPIFETLVNSVVRAVEERSSRTGLPIAPRLLLMLEEAANCAPLRRLATIASAGRGQGIQLVSVWQDEAQIETVFGAAKARTVMNNHIGHLVLPGIKDQRTLERMSDLLGPEFFERESTSRGKGSTSTTTSWTSEPLYPPHRIRELEEGLALGVIRNLKPLRLRTVAWFEDPELRQLVGPAAAAAFDAAFASTAGASPSRRARGPLSGRSR